MIIQSSNIQMNATHFQQEKHTEMEMFRSFGRGGRFQMMNLTPEITETSDDRLDLSSNARRFLEDIQERVKNSHKSKEEEDQECLSVQSYMVKKIVEAVLGQEVKVIKASDLEPDCENNLKHDSASQIPIEGQPGTEYIHHETHYEQEYLNFNAQGTIRTQDGQEITFDLQLEMSRQMYSESTVALREGGKPIDPLVINYAGSAANLTSQKFSFDLDADGTNDEISFVAPGSGFLVFDKNQDNIVQNGSELFGPTTGNGFDELAQYDQDDNGWIDEKDAIYDYLSVWSKTHDGKDNLQTLKQADVGAIYLAAAKTAFDYKDMALNSHGHLNQSGVYLTESGEARLIQQLDLVA